MGANKRFSDHDRKRPSHKGIAALGELTLDYLSRILFAVQPDTKTGEYLFGETRLSVYLLTSKEPGHYDWRTHLHHDLFSGGWSSAHPSREHIQQLIGVCSSSSPTSNLLRPAPFPSLHNRLLHVHASSSCDCAPSCHRPPPQQPGSPFCVLGAQTCALLLLEMGRLPINNTLMCLRLRGLMPLRSGPFDPTLPIGSMSTVVSMSGSLKTDVSSREGS